MVLLCQSLLSLASAAATAMILMKMSAVERPSLEGLAPKYLMFTSLSCTPFK